MRKAVFATLVAVLALISAPAMAAWVGDVPDLVNPTTSTTIGAGRAAIDSTGMEYGSIQEAVGWASEGDTLLMGPGLYQEWNEQFQSEPSAGPWVWTKTLSVMGSGSGPDANTNTVWMGLKDLVDGHSASGCFLVVKSAGAQTFRDFRVDGAYTDQLIFTGGAVAPAKHPGFTFQNMAFMNAGNTTELSVSASTGWGDALSIKESFNSLIVQDSLFDGGPNNVTGGDMIGVRLAGHAPVEQSNGLITGNTFTNMKAGVVFNSYKADNFTITNNMFSNMSERTDASTDIYNPYGPAGIIMFPRRSALPASADAMVTNIAIMSNTFKDCGYLADEEGDISPPAGADFYHDAGIGATLASGASAQNVWINHNTFIDTAADGVMKRAVNILTSDANAYTLAAPGMAFTGNYGFLKNFVVGDNVYTNLADTAVRGVQWTAGAIVSPQTVFPNVVVKSAGTANLVGVTAYGDRNGDGKITGYDVSNNTLDLNGDSVVNNADKVYMVETLLHAKLGDFSLDGLVDGLDFLAWQSGFDNNPATSENYGQGETTWDNNVDGLDFLAWQSAYPTFTNANYPASYGPVPEPATLALLVLGGLAALRRRR